MTVKRGSTVYCFDENNKHILILFLIRELGTRENEGGDSQTVSPVTEERDKEWRRPIDSSWTHL